MNNKESYQQIIINAHSNCFHNRKELEKSTMCGCLYCLKIFKPNEIIDWCDNDETAICPFCGIDSIIYDNKIYPLTKDFLKDMKQFWFDGISIIKKEN